MADLKVILPENQTVSKALPSILELLPSGKISSSEASPQSVGPLSGQVSPPPRSPPAGATLLQTHLRGLSICGGSSLDTSL